MKNLILALIVSVTIVSAELSTDEVAKIAKLTDTEIEMNADKIQYTDVINYYYSQVYTKPLVDGKNSGGYFTSSYTK